MPDTAKGTTWEKEQTTLAKGTAHVEAKSPSRHGWQTGQSALLLEHRVVRDRNRKYPDGSQITKEF